MPGVVLPEGDAPAGLWDALTAQVIARGFSVTRTDPAPAWGMTTFGDVRRVDVAPGLSPAMACHTLAHELRHIATDHGTRRDVSRGVLEAEADGIAYLVTTAAGMAGSFSADYLTGWTGGDPAVVRATAARVVATASRCSTPSASPSPTPPTPPGRTGPPTPPPIPPADRPGGRAPTPGPHPAAPPAPTTEPTRGDPMTPTLSSTTWTPAVDLADLTRAAVAAAIPDLTWAEELDPVATRLADALGLREVTRAAVGATVADRDLISVEAVDPGGRSRGPRRRRRRRRPAGRGRRVHPPPVTSPAPRTTAAGLSAGSATLAGRARWGRGDRMTHPNTAGGQDPPAEAALRAVLADAAAFYRARLLQGGEPAVGLLRGRGLIDLAVDTPAGLRWRFGYAPDGGHHLLTHLRGLGHPDPVTVAAGLAARTGRRGLVDVLRDRLVVPLRDDTGVVGFAGRRLSEPFATATWVSPKWLNTATTTLYRKSSHLYGLTEQADLLTAGRGRVVLVEGPLDAVAVSLAGHVGLAAGGTALTGDHAARLRALTGPGRPLHVAYDGDLPGQAATVRAALILAGWEAVQVFLAPGEDPASILNGYGPRGLRRALT